MVTLNLPMDTDPGGSFAGEGSTQFPWDTISKIDFQVIRAQSGDDHFARRYWPLESLDIDSYLRCEFKVRPLSTTDNYSLGMVGFHNSADIPLEDNLKNFVGCILVKDIWGTPTGWRFYAFIVDDLGQVDSDPQAIDYDTYKDQWLKVVYEYIDKTLTVKVYDDMDTLILTSNVTLTDERTFSLDSLSFANNNWSTRTALTIYRADVNNLIAQTTVPTGSLVIKNTILKNTAVRAI